MNTVEPIRNPKKIEQMKQILGDYKYNATDKQILEAKRNRMLFTFGINIRATHKRHNKNYNI